MDPSITTMSLSPIFENGTVASPYPAQSDVVGSILDATCAMYVRSGFDPPWIGYLAFEGGKVVGTCGFTSPPKSGEVEIAYFTFPGNEGAGVATRMARALLQLAWRSGCVASVCAHTLPEDGPSCAVLRKVGFVLVGEVELPEDGRVWRWSKSTPGAGFSGSV